MAAPELIYHHLAVIGRLDGDDEDSVLLFEDMTVVEAKGEFAQELIDEDHLNRPHYMRAHDEVYINYVLTSNTPIDITASYTGFSTG